MTWTLFAVYLPQNIAAEDELRRERPALFLTTSELPGRRLESHLARLPKASEPYEMRCLGRLQDDGERVSAWVSAQALALR